MHAGQPKRPKIRGVGVRAAKNKYVVQDCHIFLRIMYQNGKNIPNDQKIYVPNGRNIYHLAVK
jgi:hypothetical protein